LTIALSSMLVGSLGSAAQPITASAVLVMKILMGAPVMELGATANTAPSSPRDDSLRYGDARQIVRSTRPDVVSAVIANCRERRATNRGTSAAQRAAARNFNRRHP